MRKIVLLFAMFLVLFVGSTGLAQTIHEAAEKGDIEEVKNLTNKGVEIDARGKYGETALHIAVAKGNLEMIKYLVGKGAQVNAKAKNGMTPLYGALSGNILYKNAFEIVEYLLSQGADVNAKANRGITPLHYVIIKGTNYEFMRRKLAKYLIEKGAQLNVRDDDGLMPMDYEIRTPSDWKDDISDDNSLAKYLHSMGGRSILVASLNGEMKEVKALIKEGTPVNVRNVTGWSPLLMAAEAGYIELVEYLVSKGADVNSKDNPLEQPHCTGLRVEEILRLSRFSWKGVQRLMPRTPLGKHR